MALHRSRAFAAQHWTVGNRFSYSRVALHGTARARAQCGTLRLKLLRIGAIVLRNTRRIRLLLSSAYPNRELFCLVAARLKPG